jgi:hypothetical protein
MLSCEICLAAHFSASNLFPPNLPHNREILLRKQGTAQGIMGMEDLSILNQASYSDAFVLLLARGRNFAANLGTSPYSGSPPGYQVAPAITLTNQSICGMLLLC